MEIYTERLGFGNDNDWGKHKALEEYLNIPFEEIESSNSYFMHDYKTSKGTFTVLTEEEAEKVFVDCMNERLKHESICDVLPYGYNDVIIRNSINEDAVCEMVKHYVEVNVDNLIENVVNYGDYSFFDECSEYGVNFNEDLDFDNFDDKEVQKICDEAESLATDLREAMVEAIMEDDAIAYCESRSSGCAAELFPDIAEYDSEAFISEYCTCYGYGSQLATDGQTQKYKDFYIFKQSDADERSLEFLSERDLLRAVSHSEELAVNRAKRIVCEER